jgi:type IV secretory pathway VirB2 component (pilin)
MNRRIVVWIVGCVATLMVLAAGATYLATRQANVSASVAPRSELERIEAACVEAMLRSTCQVMTGPPASSTSTVVFVAGVGPVDAKAYRELRDSGEAMCGVLRKACVQDWNGTQCRTARGLYGAAAASAAVR